MSGSLKDENIQKAVIEVGLEGYGLYWAILETIASQMDENNKTFCEYSLKFWGNLVGFSRIKFSKLAQVLEKNHLIFLKLSGDILRIDCPNLLKYRDEYALRKTKNRDKLPIDSRCLSGQTPASEAYNKEAYKEERDFKDPPVSLSLYPLSYHTTHTTPITLDEEIKKENILITTDINPKKLATDESHDHDIPIIDNSNNPDVEKPKKTPLKFSEYDLKTATDYSKWLLENTRIKQPSKAALEKWANALRMMREIDKRSEVDIDAMIDFIKHDKFWHSRVLSMVKMREKQDTLIVQMDNQRKGGKYESGRSGFDTGESEKFDLE